MGLLQWFQNRQIQKEQGERLHNIHERIHMMLSGDDVLEDAKRQAKAYCLAHRHTYHIRDANWPHAVKEVRVIERVMLLYQESFIEGYTSLSDGKPQEATSFWHEESEV